MTDQHVTHPPEASSARLRRFAIQAGPLIALIVLIVAFAVATPTFLSPGNIGILLSQLAIPLVLALGLTFVILVGGIDLSVEGVMASSSLVFVLVAANDRTDVSLGVFAFVVGVLTGSAFGLLNGLLNVRLGIPSFMVTLGMGAVGIGVATVLFGGRAPRLLDTGFREMGTGASLGIANLALLALLTLAVLWLVQSYTKVGRYSYMIGGDEATARMSGVPVGKFKIIAFTLAGTTSGLAGVMAASQLGIGSPTIGSGFLFTSITAVVLGGTLLVGGRGGVLRTLVGVSILIVLANGLILIGVESYVQVALQGLVIIVAVVASGWRLRRRVRVIK